MASSMSFLAISTILCRFTDVIYRSGLANTGLLLLFILTCIFSIPSTSGELTFNAFITYSASSLSFFFPIGAKILFSMLPLTSTSISIAKWSDDPNLPTSSIYYDTLQCCKSNMSIAREDLSCFSVSHLDPSLKKWTLVKSYLNSSTRIMSTQSRFLFMSENTIIFGWLKHWLIDRSVFFNSSVASAFL